MGLRNPTPAQGIAFLVVIFSLVPTLCAADGLTKAQAAFQMADCVERGLEFRAIAQVPNIPSGNTYTLRGCIHKMYVHIYIYVSLGLEVGGLRSGF